MTTENFAYWLKGFFEISESNTLNEKQIQIIKDHLDLVFQKVTPNYPLSIPNTITPPIQNPQLGKYSNFPAPDYTNEYKVYCSGTEGIVAHCNNSIVNDYSFWSVAEGPDTVAKGNNCVAMGSISTSSPLPEITPDCSVNETTSEFIYPANKSSEQIALEALGVTYSKTRIKDNNSAQ